MPGSLTLRPVVGFFLASFFCFRWCSATWRDPKKKEEKSQTFVTTDVDDAVFFTVRFLLNRKSKYVASWESGS